VLPNVALQPAIELSVLREHAFCRTVEFLAAPTEEIREYGGSKLVYGDVQPFAVSVSARSSAPVMSIVIPIESSTGS
jgi:hypothetical protein